MLSPATRRAGADCPEGAPAGVREAEPDPGFGIYVHWPFCRSKCPYCDFNSHVREGVDEARWRRALVAELTYFARLTGARRVTSLFFGGGTPSLMEPATVAAVIDTVRRLWRPAAEMEVTLEANPGSAEAGRFAAYRDAGVNRVSVGVQALDDRALAFLGRAHDAAEAVAAVERAAAVFPRFSFDLIYGLPGQETAAWRRELRRAAMLARDHVSLYQLTVEPGTPFHTAHRLGRLTLPDEERAAALYETTQEVLAARGLFAYEISNHARKGAECRHNLTYWRYGDYVGVGPGAHGRLRLGGEKLAWRQIRGPERWLAAVEARGHASAERRALSPAERRTEMLLMGLRLAEGVAGSRFRAETGAALEDALDAEALARLAEAGLVEWDARGLRATAAGRQRLDAVLCALLA